METSLSLKSPQALGSSEIVLISENWLGPLFAHYFSAQGAHCSLVELNHTGQSLEHPVYLGNGELPEKAEKIYGTSLAKSIWSLSEENQKSAQRLFKKLKLNAKTGHLKWMNSASEVQYEEPSLLFSRAELGDRLREGLGIPVIEVDEIELIRKKAVYEYELSAKKRERSIKKTAPIFIVLSDWVGYQKLDFLKDKLIPVTLSVFVQSCAKKLAEGLYLFNSGADFFSCRGGDSQMGSFRNLYQDKAVGRLNEIDPVTRKGVSDFFSGLSWVSKKHSLYEGLSYASLSCDGLALAGNLPEATGIFFVGGFAGREQNFVFSVAERLAESIVKGSPLDGLLEYCSTRRFL